MTVGNLLVGMFLACALWNHGLTRSAEALSRQPFTSSVDLEDDPVLDAVSRRRRERRLDKVNDIPALTDKTFSSTVYSRHNKLVLVLFYIPFDPVGLLFLKHYEQAGTELAARTGAISSSSHPLARVNCHDWTDVCRKENVTSYPVIHLYQEGKWRQQYRDALDRAVLVRTVFLLQCEQPLWLNTEREVRLFLNGRLPEPAHELVDNLVLLKPSISLNEVAAFKEVIHLLGTQMLFAVVRPDVQAQIGMEVGVLHVRLNDDHQPYDTLTHPLDFQSVRQFLLTGKWPLLPELTFRNFPELYGRQQPLALLFRSPEDPDAVQHVRTVVDTIRSGRVHNFTFCTMAVHENNPAAEELLRTYTGQTLLPAFVIVDLHKRTVHSYQEEALSDKALLVWMLMVQHGKISPTSHLVEESWKPASRHIDFLDKLDRDRERKEKTNIHNRGVHEDQMSHPDAVNGEHQKQTMSSADREECSGTLSTAEESETQSSEREQAQHGNSAALHTDL